MSLLALLRTTNGDTTTAEKNMQAMLESVAGQCQNLWEKQASAVQRKHTVKYSAPSQASIAVATKLLLIFAARKLRGSVLMA
jgi:hypothetical protein